jgi:hypothetical protein
MYNTHPNFRGHFHMEKCVLYMSKYSIHRKITRTVTKNFSKKSKVHSKMTAYYCDLKRNVFHPSTSNLQKSLLSTVAWGKKLRPKNTRQSFLSPPKIKPQKYGRYFPTC